MLAKIKYKEEDFKRFAKFSIEKSLKIIIICSIVVAVAVVVQLIAFFMGGDIDWWLNITVVVLMGLSYFMIWYSYKMPLKINMKRYINDTDTVEIEVLEDKLVAKELRGEELLNLSNVFYNTIYRVVESSHGFYIYINKLAAIIIPKRELSEEWMLQIQTVLAKNIAKYEKVK